DGRIIDHDLRHYNTSRVVFRPAQMSPELLLEGYLWMYREFYSWRTIIERLPDQADRLRPYLAFNLVYRKAAPVASLIARLGLMGPLGRLGKALSYWRPRGTLATGAVQPKPLPTEAIELGEP
ncbi:MAG: hypothetical protein JXL80_14465, partial [Planctomycetes bacterium]|nr:hypothetical protein [Planctomycetota bacterium]